MKQLPHAKTHNEFLKIYLFNKVVNIVSFFLATYSMYIYVLVSQRYYLASYSKIRVQI